LLSYNESEGAAVAAAAASMRRTKLSRGERMRIIFDLMGTIFGAVDMSLRPGIKETIEGLRSRGCLVDFWTSGPMGEYKFLLRRHGIEGAVYSKLEKLPFTPDLCVDDLPDGYMPFKILKVSTHISEEEPGKTIDPVAVFSGMAP